MQLDLSGGMVTAASVLRARAEGKEMEIFRHMIFPGGFGYLFYEKSGPDGP